MKGRLWPSALVVASVLGCGSVPELQEPATGAETQAVLDGVESPSDEAVVMLRTYFGAGLGENRCTGTLLAPSVVLTAMRCITALDTAFTCRRDGSLSPPDSGAGWFESPVSPETIHVHLGPRAAETEPAAYGARVFGTGTLQACIDDVALVVLDRDLPFAPLPVRLEGAPSRGDHVSVVGFGDTTMSKYSFVRARRDGVEVLAVGPPDTSQGEPTVIPRTFVTDDGPCNGDIGGPALDPGTGAVVGVYSRSTTNSACYVTGQTHVFMQSAPYARLIREALATVGAEPLAEKADPLPKRRSSCTVSARGADAGGVALMLLAALGLARTGRVRSRRARRTRLDEAAP